MNYMLDPIIGNRFKELPVEYQNFITSDYPYEVAEVYGSSLKLSEDGIDVLENGLIFYLMFLFNENEFIDYVVTNTGASRTETTDVISTICRHLPEFVNHKDYIEILESSQPLSEDIAETEKMYASIQGLRTMAGDAQVVQAHEEPVYQSSQSALLSPTVPPLPPTPYSSIPRWDTEH